MKISAGLLAYRFTGGELEVLLGHPGGPYYEGKDDGYWGIPKGRMEAHESLMEAAIREFIEETGFYPALKNLISLGKITESQEKDVYVWAFLGSYDTSGPVQSNFFSMEWPRGSGVVGLYPELDRLSFFSISEAKRKIHPAQARFLDRLAHMIFAQQIS